MKPRNLAGCVISDDNGAILLMLRNRPGRVQWELPGGKQEPNEILEVTAKRELKEELGINVEVLDEIGFADFEFEGFDWRYYWFKAKILNSETPVIMEKDKFDEMKYWSMEDIALKNAEMSQNVLNLVEKM